MTDQTCFPFFTFYKRSQQKLLIQKISEKIVLLYNSVTFSLLQLINVLLCNLRFLLVKLDFCIITKKIAKNENKNIEEIRLDYVLFIVFTSRACPHGEPHPPNPPHPPYPHPPKKG